MRDDNSFLTSFNVVDELGTEFELNQKAVLTVNCKRLSLGALAEVLILRQAWREAGASLRIEGRTDLRHAAVSKVTSNARATFEAGNSVGAFHVVSIQPDIELVTHDFVQATGRAAVNAGMPVKPSRMLKAVYGELIDNISAHAGNGAKGIAAYEVGVKSIGLVVADSGQGIVRGYLETKPELAGIDAMTALERAVKDNQSRFHEPGRGLGFARVLEAVRAMDAALRVRSDDASIEVEGQANEAVWSISEQAPLRGFVVTLHFSW